MKDDSTTRTAADSRWRAVYDWALYLYPHGFQDRFAADMSRTFAKKLGEVRVRGSGATGVFLLGEFAGLLGGALKVRLTGGDAEGGLPPSGHRRPRPFSRIGQELRHAARRLSRSRGFTAASVVTLGLGVGATTAVYSLVHSTVLSPLPYADSEELLWLDHSAPGIGADAGLGMTPGLYTHYLPRVGAFEELAIWRYLEITLSANDPERISAVQATPSLFAALRVRPLLGRAFTDADVQMGTGAVVISHRLWQRRLGGDPEAVGRTIRANGNPVEILGVMPPAFEFPSDEIDLWAPLTVQMPASNFGGFSYEGVARLVDGATRASAEAEVRAAIPSLVDVYGQVQRMLDDTQLAPWFPTLKESIVQDAQQTLWILLGSVAFVLLLACANVANLLLVRTESRHQEAAVRRALGAGRRDIVRYFLSEGFLLSIGGAALGLGLAIVAVRVLLAVGPEHLPRLSELSVSAPAFLMTGAILLLTTLLFGLLPGMRRGPTLASTVKAAGRGVQGGRASSRGRNALVVTQVSLALVLLVATGLMTRSFLQLVSLDPGFVSDGTLTFEVGVTSAGYETATQAVAFHRAALDQMAALPGVEAAGVTTCLPLCGSWAGTQLTVEGRPRDPDTVLGVVAIRRVNEDYFSAVQTRLVEGRLPTRFDQEAENGSAIISRELAKDYWPDEDPMGARFKSDAGGDAWYTIVGIVDNTPIVGLDDDPPPMAYLPLLHQNARDRSPYQLTYVLRTSARPQSLVGPVREIIRALDPEVPIASVTTLDDIVAESNVSTAFTTAVLGVASGIALILGLVGIYGVISYTVGRRSKEIGIRMALGAKSGQVSRSVLAQGGKVTVVGLLIGMVAAFGLTRVMRDLLFGVSPLDPLTFATVPLVLLGVALAATYIPARRAARVDPAETLRAD